MYVQFFLKGILIGASVSAPMGPVGLLCLNRSLTEGRVCGFVSGLGATTADVLFCIIAGGGFTFVSQFLLDQALWIRLVGSLCLVLLGMKIFLSRPVERQLSLSGENLAQVYVSTFFLTLINPTTILFFMALFTGLGLTMTEESYVSLGVLTAGVLAGAVLYWFVLTGIVSMLHRRLGIGDMKWINRVSGFLIIVLGFLVFMGVAK